MGIKAKLSIGLGLLLIYGSMLLFVPGLFTIAFIIVTLPPVIKLAML